MSTSILTLKDYGVKNGNKTILNSITLEVGEKGILNILGSAGSGKTTLFRTLSGFNDSNSNFTTSGEVNYKGMPIGKAGYPSMVMQNARLMLSSILENILHELPDRKNLNLAQQHDKACHLLESADLGELVDSLEMSVIDLPLETMRHLAIARVCAADPDLIFIDDPTTGLENDCPHKMLNFIQKESEKRVVVVATESQKHARLLGGRSILLANGQIKEDGSLPGNLQAEESRKASVDRLSVTVDINDYKKDEAAPKGFKWLKRGEIAALPQLGIVTDLEQDLTALQKIGVTHLITLTSEEGPIDQALLAKYNISSIYEPIDDLSAPTVEQASYLCEEIGHSINKGNVVALHCGASFGRVGMVLASHLIWEGLTAQLAIDSVAALEPKYERSEEQLQFLKEFARETTGLSDFETNVVNKIHMEAW